MFEISDGYRNVFVLCIAVVVVICVYKIYNYKNQFGTKQESSDKKVTFEVDDKIVMYGKDSCPWCKRQKTELGDKWSMVKYINCKDSPELCESNNITFHGEIIIKEFHQMHF